jgi:hypothetical protein
MLAHDGKSFTKLRLDFRRSAEHESDNETLDLILLRVLNGVERGWEVWIGGNPSILDMVLEVNSCGLPHLFVHRWVRE